MLPRLTGAFAIAFLFRDHPDLIIGARMGAPLTVGYGEGENYLGSDALAVAPWTQRIAYLDEGDWAVVRRDSDRDLRPRQPAGRARDRRVPAHRRRRSRRAITRHYMQKEIFEQPIVVAQTLQSYVRPFEGEVALPVADADLESVNRLTIVACGTSYYAGLVAKYWIEQFARVPVDIDVASEFRYREPVLEPGGLALFISQSGETADTLAALRHARAQQQRIAVVVNVPTSSMAREADLLLPTHAGPEIGVASTKAFTCQLAVLAALAANLARAKGRLSREEEKEIVAHLQEAPAALNAALGHDDDIAAMAHLIAPARDVLYLGRGPDYPMALEGALKLKEISYIHAEGYAAGEMKHGPIALIDDDVPVIVLAPSGPLFEKTVSNMQEVRARGGKIVLISDAHGIAEAGEGCMATIEMPAGAPADRAAGLCGAGAAAGLSCRGAEGHRRRPAAQPRQERHGRMKHIGILSHSFEGATLCYRTMCLEGVARLGPHRHPEITLTGVAMASYDGCVGRATTGRRFAACSPTTSASSRPPARTSSSAPTTPRISRLRARASRSRFPACTSARWSPTRRSARGARRSRSSAPIGR